MELFMSPEYFIAILIRQPVDTFLRDDCKPLFQCCSTVTLRSTPQLGMEVREDGHVGKAGPGRTTE